MLSYAKNLLIDDEEIKYYTKRNMLVSFYKPVLVHIGALVLAGIICWAGELSAGPGVLVVLIALLAPLPYSIYVWLWWVNKYYLVTNFRVLKVEGILNKVHRDASLDQINDLSLSEPLLGRVLGYGHLQVMTANEDSGVTYHFIKDAVDFKKMVTTWKEHVEEDGYHLARGRRTALPQAEEPDDEDPISQIERLGELAKKGFISQEEFESKKQELLKQVE